MEIGPDCVAPAAEALQLRDAFLKTLPDLKDRLGLKKD